MFEQIINVAAIRMKELDGYRWLARGQKQATMTTVVTMAVTKLGPAVTQPLPQNPAWPLPSPLPRHEPTAKWPGQRSLSLSVTNIRFSLLIKLKKSVHQSFVSYLIEWHKTLRFPPGKGLRCLGNDIMKTVPSPRHLG